MDRMGLSGRASWEFYCDEGPVCRQFLTATFCPFGLYDGAARGRPQTMPRVDMCTDGSFAGCWSSQAEGQGRRG
eukprot:7602332-Lingulodinium_polyedra.AAC.1